MMEATTNRRRSYRLFIQVPITVEGLLAGKSKFSESTQTIVVNAHGALVQLSAALEQGQVVTLRNMRTSDVSECAVKLVTPAEAGKFNIALEFTTPNPSFWHVSFPPDDWSQRHPDAKKFG